MNLAAALKAISADGTIYFEWKGAGYRLILRGGLLRMVIQEEPGTPRILPRDEALKLLHEVGQYAADVSAKPDFWQLDVDPANDLFADPEEVIDP